VRKLNEVIHQALEASRLTHVPAVLATESSERDGSPADQIVGRSPAMQEVYKLIGRLAPQDVPILILGESGSGKELVARAIYHCSRRNQKTFMAINCAALSESLLESELFGHERGAFTGADQRRIGKFEQASGGTIFLDEIGDMTPATQAKALRLLQQQSFERLGGNVTIQTDVRIIAATNQNLSALVEQGRFRLDLYYRLNGFTIEIPPLRERIEDVAPLADHFLRIYNRKFRRGVVGFTPEAMHRLEAHLWPGNIRELESAVEFAVIKAGGERVGVHDLPEACRPSETDTSPAAVVAESLQLKELVERLLAEGSHDVYRSVNEAVDREVLQRVMQHCAGNQHRAAEVLGVSRMTLRAKLRALGLLSKKPRSDGDNPRQ
jgi:two-component system nitrogen regulation response regulator GlnG